MTSATITARRVRTMQDRGDGLRWVVAWRAYDFRGEPIGAPQETRALALAWAADTLRREGRAP